MTQEERFIHSYIETALWAETDDNERPLDDNYGPTDLDKESRQKMEADCRSFLAQVEAAEIDLDEANLLNRDTYEQAGHDFWLTRNGHGAGFWDGDWEKEAGKKLTDMAHAFGSSDIYVSDDGQLYIL